MIFNYLYYSIFFRKKQTIFGIVYKMSLSHGAFCYIPNKNTDIPFSEKRNVGAVKERKETLF